MKASLTPLRGSSDGHTGTQLRPRPFPHPDKPRCNISGRLQPHKGKARVRISSSLLLTLLLSSFADFISLSLDPKTSVRINCIRISKRNDHAGEGLFRQRKRGH
jgi:hypothetical protein